MIHDLRTIMWKEFKDLKQLLTGSFGQKAGLVFFLVVFGVFMPLQSGPAFREAPFLLFVFSFMSLFSVIQVVPDSFAGERERHTLETLLATRLTDKGILFGKILTIILYGWLMAVAIKTLVLLTVNFAFSEGEIIFPSLPVLIASLLGGFLVSMFGTCTGVFISMKAPTVRHAHQSLAWLVMGIWFMPIMIGPILFRVIPQETIRQVTGAVKQINPVPVLFIVNFLLLLVNLVILYFVLKRYKRTQLILS